LLALPCHNVSGSNAPSPSSKAPSFKYVANLPGASLAALTVWSRTPHSSMPNLIVEPKDRDDVIAYILSLKDRRMLRCLAGLRWWQEVSSRERDVPPSCTDLGSWLT
jgi:hypothetical protein